VTTRFDSKESSSGHYEPYAGISIICVHSWDPNTYYKDKRL